MHLSVPFRSCFTEEGRRSKDTGRTDALSDSRDTRDSTVPCEYQATSASISEVLQILKRSGWEAIGAAAVGRGQQVDEDRVSEGEL